jgi:biotin carboxyl carrier protein
MIYEVTVHGTVLEVDVVPSEDGYRVSVDGAEAVAVDLRQPEAHVLSLMAGGFCYEAGVVERDDGWDVDIYGTTHSCTVVDPKRKALRLEGGRAEGMLSTSMPGRIVRLLVDVGQVVEAGQPVMIVEAMKMENEMKAPVAGRIDELMVAEGDAVEAGATLARIEQDENP